ncbi:Rpp1 [Kluyveromyces lactis]|nr:Rpp1 [Kluyveromyces lactis]
MLVDLNVPWPQKDFATPPSTKEIKTLHKTLATLHTLGYTHIALNFTVNQQDKFPKSINDMNPIDLSHFDELVKSTGLKLYTRITIIIDDLSKGQPLTKISQAFDIVAALPVSEKAVTLVTSSLDVDVLSFYYDKRLPTLLKHHMMGGCIKRGVKVEIVYANALRDIRTRRQFVSNVKSVIRTCRNRGIVVSSGATSPLECRNVIGVTSILNFIGLPNDKSRKAMGELASLVLLNGRLRNKSYKQVICIGNEDVVNEDFTQNSSFKIVKRKNPDTLESDDSKRIKS